MGWNLRQEGEGWGGIKDNCLDFWLVHLDTWWCCDLGQENQGQEQIGNEVVMPGEPSSREKGPEGREIVYTWDWRPRRV